MQSERNEEEKTKKLFETLFAHISGLAGAICFKIWFIDSPSSGASVEKIWLNWGTVSDLRAT